MKVGLCLAGGGTKGIAHIGAIKAFNEAGVEFDFIAGTSSGSIVATLYALGYTPEEMYAIFKKYVKKINYIDLRNIINIIVNFLKTGNLEITGLNSGEKIYKLVKKFAEKKNIQNINQIKIPILIPSVNIYNENLYVFYSKDVLKNINIPNDIRYINDADIATVVQASCSYPGIFCPCDKFENTLLIDGGIAENLPWRELKRVGADEVVSIIFTDTKKKKCCSNIVEILNKSFSILCNEFSKYEIDGTDYLLEIKTKSNGLLDKKNLDDLYKEGYDQTKKFIYNKRFDK